MDSASIDLISQLVPEAFEDNRVPVPYAVHPHLRRTEGGGLERFIVGVWAVEVDLHVPFRATDEYRLPEEADPTLWGRMAEGGTEAIAWYVSYHYTRERWGIYFDMGALQAYTLHTFGSLRGQFPDGELLCLSYWLVLNHELFHYRIDVAATRMELAAMRPFYLPYRQVHPSPNSDGGRLEEALANASSWHRARAVWRSRSRMATPGASQYPSGPGLPQFSTIPPLPLWLPLIERQMSSSPPGYRDWGKCKERAAFRAGQERLVSLAHAAGFGRRPVHGPFEWFIGRGGRVPVYLLAVSPPPRGLKFAVPYS